MLRLLGKEIKMTVKSITFLLCIILIVAMYITQCIPKKWYWYAHPMDDMHLYYTVMKEDYKNGYTQKFASLEKINLSEVMKSKLKEIIHLMNPDVHEGELVENIQFSLTDQEYITAMEELDKELGGGSYYVPHYHQDFYTSYTEALGVKLLITKEEITNEMEVYLDFVITTGEYTQYTNLIGRRISLTDKELLNISQVYDNMKDAKQRHLNTDDLFEVYDSSYINIDKLLGGNTSFGIKYRHYMLQVTNSLDEAVSNYESIKDDEKITNAYARYYSDYFSILAGLLPAIFGGFTLIEDRKWKMHELIYPRAISSMKYVFLKFFAVAFSFMLCFYIFAGISTFLFVRFGLSYQLSIDYFAFFKYTTYWVMPTVIFTIAFTMFISLIFQNGIIPLMFQLILFFLSSRELIGGYHIWRPIIRYNKIGQVETYLSNLPSIITNRIFITLISFILLIGSVKIYSRLRLNSAGIHLWRRNKNACIHKI